MNTPTDTERIHDALRYYLERVTWTLHDTERQEYERLLHQYRDKLAQERQQ